MTWLLPNHYIDRMVIVTLIWAISGEDNFQKWQLTILGPAFLSSAMDRSAMSDFKLLRQIR